MASSFSSSLGTQSIKSHILTPRNPQTHENVQDKLQKWIARSLQADTETTIIEVITTEIIIEVIDIIVVDMMIVEATVVITITEDATIEDEVAREAEREEEEEEMCHLRNVVDWWH